MKNILRNVLLVTAIVSWVFSVQLTAQAVDISQTPTGFSVKPNIILAYDDSGSMAWTYIDNLPDSLPSTPSRSILRMSNHYNPVYYNPNVTYTPWVKSKNSDGTLTRYPDAPLSMVSSFIADTDNDLNEGAKLLSGETYQVTYSCSKSGSSKYDKTYDYETGSTFTSRSLCQDKSSDTFTMSSEYTVKKGQSWNKLVVVSTATYYDLQPSTGCTVNNSTCFTAPVCVPSIGDNCGTTSSGAVLKKVVIPGTDTAQLQNFANWKQYANTRQKMVAFAMSAVLPKLTGVNVGFDTFNASSVTNNAVRAIDSSIASKTYQSTAYYARSGRMFNLDVPSEVNTLLDLVYNAKPDSNTPTRTTLNRIGGIYSNKDLTLTSVKDDGTAFTSKGVIQFACQKNAAFVLTDGYTNETPTSLTVPSYTASTYGSGKPYTETKATSLADIALSYYTNNLRPDLPTGNVPVDSYTTGNADLNKNLHMNTYALTLGEKGNIYGMFDTVNGVNHANNNLDPYTYHPAWVFDSTKTYNADQIDDLWHSTINGRGMMFEAKDTNSLIKQIEDGLMNVVLRAGSRASIGKANTYMTDGNNYLYVPSYNSSGWFGDVKKYEVTLSNATVIQTPSWSAGTLLNAITNKATTRKIVTFNGTSGVAFDASNTSLPASLVAYIRGDTSLDGTTYRKRVSVFGDIVNATPAVVITGSGDTTATTIYQPSNDGMVHAIDAANGNELWAYVPRLVQSSLANYASPSGSHKYLVDGSPMKFKVGSKTMIVGGLGFNTANSGFYALDVSTPTATSEANAAAKVMWEFPTDDTTRKNLGTSTSHPLLLKIKAYADPVLVISSGYNNGTATGDTGGDGKGHVWFLDPLTGAIKNEFIMSNNGSPSAPLNMSSLMGFVEDPAVDTNATALYGGNLSGDVWKIDISSATLSSWNYYKVATVKSSTNTVQPITSEIKLSFDPNDRKAVLFFGTGQLFNGADASSNTKQSFYAIKDTGSALTPSSLINKVVTVASNGERTVSDPYGIVFDWTKHNGWYFDFPSTGERLVGELTFSEDRLVFGTSAISVNSCSSPSYMYVLDTSGKGKVNDVDDNGIAGVPLDDEGAPTTITIGTTIFAVSKDANGAPRLTVIGHVAGAVKTFSRLASWREIIRK